MNRRARTKTLACLRLTEPCHHSEAGKKSQIEGVSRLFLLPQIHFLQTQRFQRDLRVRGKAMGGEF